jgi:hypothetical protein
VDEDSGVPAGVFFSARRSTGPLAGAAGLLYERGTGNVRRVRFAADGRFVLAALAAGASVVSVGAVLFVPEVDPRQRRWGLSSTAATPGP